MSHIPTIKIVCDANKRSGYKIINKSDFDAKTMKAFKEKPAPKTSKKESE